MAASQRDRNAIGDLNAPRGGWMKQPTTIGTPGVLSGNIPHQNPMGALGAGGILNLSRGSTGRNIRKGMNPKQKKSQFQLQHQRKAQPTSEGRPPKRLKTNHSTTQATATIISNGSSSTDDLNLHWERSESYEILLDSDKPPELTGPRPSTSLQIAPDGDTAREVLHTIVISDDEDEIENSSTPPRRNVKAIVKGFEALSKDNRSNSSSTKGEAKGKSQNITLLSKVETKSKLPLVDLAAKARERKRKQDITGPGRPVPSMPTTNQFTSYQPTAKPKVMTQNSLPVKAFVSADQSEEGGQLNLRWERQRFFIYACNTHMRVNVRIDGISPQLVSPDKGVNFMLARLDDVCIVFDTQDEEWSEKKYEAFIENFQEKTYISPVAARKVWEHLRNAATEAREQVERISKKESTSETHIVSESSDQTGGSKSPLQNHRRSVSSDPRTVEGASSKSRSPGARGKPETQVIVAPRRSTRSSVTTQPVADPDEVILVYPQGVPGAVNITNADVARLEPGEYLNDTLIEFGLKLWLKRLEETNPSLAAQVHVFSSFFYKKLNKKNIVDGFNSVCKWTSKFDIFQKKYIIVPIHENLHWYFALIYEPEHLLAAAVNDATELPTSILPEVEVDAPQVLEQIPISESEADIEQDLTNLTQACSIDGDEVEVRLNEPGKMDVEPSNALPSPTLSYTDGGTTPCGEPSPMDLDPEIEVVEESEVASPPPSRLAHSDAESCGPDILNIVDGATDSDENARKSSEIPTESFYANPPSASASSKKQYGKQKKASQRKVEEDRGPQPNTTYIFTLDSLGAAHKHATAQLGKYLQHEARHKKNANAFHVKVLGRQVLVPMQPNYCDCGLYLLHLAQTFVSNPQFYFERSASSAKSVPNAERQKDWHDEKVPKMREQLLSDIKQLSQEWKKTRPAKGPTSPSNTKEEVVSDSDDIIVEVGSTRPAKKARIGPKSTVSTRMQAAKRLR
ncbi:cysteine proteinase [Coprinopsis marcescibilis]|uniref:Cysteine proteinase n=1 Tax=Coprinopsis marcescibilis TaxID=230819 RepID=A0A5C3L5L0_COPMA|nr:cysteine proteinase [Coprinopsis marcescibilis]